MAAVRGDISYRPDRRSSLHLQRARQALHEGELRQRLRRSLPQVRYPEGGPRGPQVQGHRCGVQGCQSLMRCSDGEADGWQLTTPARQAVVVWRYLEPASWESEQRVDILSPHL